MYVCNIIDIYFSWFIMKKIHLKNIIKESVTIAINDFIKEKTLNATLEMPSTQNATGSMINEMARINKKETGRCLFPYNTWELKIWSNDHTPPHFHIICDGWNVSYKIEDGNMLQIEGKGKNDSILDYMEQHVKEWLSTKCFVQPKLTNQENAMLQWEQLHDE